MREYYEGKLSGDDLQKCYELASLRIRECLDAEIRFVMEQTRGAASFLELGCGYGRVLKRIGLGAKRVVGCDTSPKSLEVARSYVLPRKNIELVRTDASCLAFPANVFGAVVCVQNGISAFGVDRGKLAAEAVRVARPNGRILFSSYSPGIWEERLEWFRAQARERLIGEIDEARTGGGTIVCKDGFRATTVDGDEFVRLFRDLGESVTIREVDRSSLFCVVTK